MTRGIGLLGLAQRRFEIQSPFPPHPPQDSRMARLQFAAVSSDAAPEGYQLQKGAAKGLVGDGIVKDTVHGWIV